jgi:hypothetical protein
MQNARCPYCGEDGSKGNMNKEHVVPRALGGNLEPTNPFAIRAHERCNRTLGKWVDAPFIRSWVLHNARALAGHQFLDPACKPVLPLLYGGRSRDWDDPAIECELWIGPTGDAVYHFHAPYPTGPAFVGRPSWLKPDAADPGVVFLAIVGSNPAWHPIIIDSTRDTFEGATLHLLNAAPTGHDPPYPPVAPAHQRFVDWIHAFRDTKRSLESAVDTECGDRFLVKVALGIGTVLLGDAFVESTDAAVLRRALWTRKTADWPDEIRGRGFFQRVDPMFVELLSWNGCHTVFVAASGNDLGVTLNLYGKHCGTMLITGAADLWKGRVGADGMLWLVAPGFRAFAGPMTTVEYAAEREVPRSGGPIEGLQRRFAGAHRLPPFHLAS